MGLFTIFFLGFLLFCACMCFSQPANVYLLQPKYPAVGDEGVGSMSPFVSRDARRIGRRLQANQTAIFGLKGNVVPDGLYYVTMLVGNPPKPYYLDVDSGSPFTWIQCDAPCISCGKGSHPLYVPKSDLLVPGDDPLCAAVQGMSVNNPCPCVAVQGMSVNNPCPSGAQQCDYCVEYADHSSSMGVLVRDSVQAFLTKRTWVTAISVFGCGYDQGGPFIAPTARMDGVLGIGNGMASLTYQWAKQGLIKNVIGHCISGGGRDGGYMFFGDDHVPTSAMTWVPGLSGKYYDVGPPRMMFGDKLLDKDGDGKKLGRIIFDSGSSYTYFTNQAYGAFLSAVKENLARYQLEQDSSDSFLSLCWRGKKRFRSVAEAAPYFECLTLIFESARGKQMKIHPEGYLVISTKGNVCLGILNGSEVGNLDTNILGDISLQGYLVVYDNEENRIGWAHLGCQKLPSSESSSFTYDSYSIGFSAVVIIVHMNLYMKGIW